MVVDQGSVHSSGRYFNFQPGEDKAAWNVDSLADELEDILVCSLRRRLISDVPLGAFLSGGVDSAIIAALIRKRLNRPLHTFSLGFTNTPFSEHEAARSTARHLGCTHHECLVPPEELGKYTVVANALDEPNADTSCLPLFLLSRFARTKIKVAVSGDGADEMFAGYSRYARMQALVGNGETRSPVNNITPNI
jgi:asparagine synthase (glutamine-hydrolysing)